MSAFCRLYAHLSPSKDCPKCGENLGYKKIATALSQAWRDDCTKAFPLKLICAPFLVHQIREIMRSQDKLSARRPRKNLVLKINSPRNQHHVAWRKTPSPRASKFAEVALIRYLLIFYFTQYSLFANFLKCRRRRTCEPRHLEG